MTTLTQTVRKDVFSGRAVVVVAAYIGLYVALDWISYVAPVAPFAITPWNPPPGLSIALLVIFGLRYWPALIVSAITAEIAVRGLPEPPLYALVSTVVMVSGYTLIAMALKRKLDDRISFESLWELAWFIAVTVLFTLPIAASYVAVLTFAGMIPKANFLFNMTMFWIGDVIGVIVTTPFLLLIWQLARTPIKGVRFSQENGLQGVALLLTLWVVFGLPYTDEFKFFYLLFIPLIWIAVREGFKGAVVAIVCTQLGLITWAYVRDEESVTVLELQALMVALALSGQFLGMAVSERRSAAQRLGEREEELQEALRLAAASEMYSAIAHELNQPLAAISHFAWASRKILEKPELDRPLLTETIESTLGEARRAGSVVQRLRDLYLGGLVRKEEVDLNGIIQSAVTSLSARLVRENVSLKVNLREPSPVAVDPIQITAVIHNILANAIDALAGANISASHREIAVSTRISDSFAEVAIDDSGPGVASDIQERVFAAFATDKAKGLGLGLAICRSIIEAHGGRIWLERSTMGGARFCFTVGRRGA